MLTLRFQEGRETHAPTRDTVCRHRVLLHRQQEMVDMDAKPFDDRVDEDGFFITTGERTRTSTIESWFNGDGHTKRRKPREKELTKFAMSIIDAENEMMK